MFDQYFRPVKGKPRTRDIAVVDIEARDWVKAYAVGVYDGGTYTDFVDHSFADKAVPEALKYLLTPKFAGRWIYAHNGGNYDFTFFLRHLICDPELRGRYHVEITPIGSTIVSFDVTERATSERGMTEHKDKCVSDRCKGCLPRKRHGGKVLHWTFVDSARLMPLPLRQVCETLGATKKVELTMSYYELSKPENAPTMRHYLKVDCVALYQAISKLQVIVNDLGGQIGITLPSTSLDLFRRKFLKRHIDTNRHFMYCTARSVQRKHNERAACASIYDDRKEGEVAPSACLHDFIRKAYFGGRTEIYRRSFAPYNGVTVAKMYDINSHYPSCMTEPMPVGPALVMDDVAPDSIAENLYRGAVGIIDCDVEIPRDCYLPPLPTRGGKQGDKLIFPTGKLRGTWDAAELSLLPDVGGRILKVRRAIWFEAEAIFAGFVETLYRYRDKSRPGWNAAMDWIAKIFLNSAYGKFAMKEERSRIMIGPDSPEGMRPISFEADAWEAPTFVSPLYIVPQLSVHVTALARARLWRILSGIVAAGGRIYYTDTDSGIISGAELSTGGHLGALKLEAQIRRAEFVLPKLYLLETDEIDKKKKAEQHLRVKAKGMGPGVRIDDKPDLLAGQLSEAEFMDLVKKGTPIQRHRLTKLREALNDYARKSLSFPRIVEQEKTILSQYDKREFLDDGNTRPKHVEMF